MQNDIMNNANNQDHLPRLDPTAYNGQAYVHWIMTIEARRTGWLIPAFYYKFRELLTHTAFRYRIACPMYCLMPDHIHMLWVGIDDRSNQLKASRYFRKQVGIPLSRLGFELQHQAFDHVLRKDERLEAVFEDTADYIPRNPERKGIVQPNGYGDYKFTSCLIPGYPELDVWQEDYWPRFWRTYSFLRKNGLFRPSDEEIS